MTHSTFHKKPNPDSIKSERRNNRRKRRQRRISYFGKMFLIISGIILAGTIALEMRIILPDKGIRRNNKAAASSSLAASSFLAVTPLCQNPDLPTGCESCCAAMVLEYLGVKTDMLTVASLLPMQKIESREGQLFGADPEEFFIGSPFETYHCFGCFENVIIKTVNNYYEGVCARKVYGDLEDFCTEFIDHNLPVMIWATMNMKAATYTSHWTLPDGREYYWPSGEHCLLLVGYDEFYYYLNDPLEGSMMAYPKETVQAVYEEMGSRAVVIYPS